MVVVPFQSDRIQTVYPMNLEAFSFTADGIKVVHFTCTAANKDELDRFCRVFGSRYLINEDYPVLRRRSRLA